MKLRLCLVFFIFSCISATLKAQLMGASLVTATPLGKHHHMHWFGIGLGFNYESIPKFRVSEKLSASVISSICFYSLGNYDKVENVAFPSDASRRSDLKINNFSLGLNLGMRLKTTSFKKISLYADVFGRMGYFNSSTIYSLYNATDDDEEDSYEETFFSELIPQVGVAGGIMYNFEEFSINFRVRYFRGGPITLVNSNNLSKEENDIVYYNLDEPVGSDVLTFQLGFLWKVVE